MSHYDCPCMEKCPLHYAMSVIGSMAVMNPDIT